MGHDGMALGYPTPIGFRRLTGCQRDPWDKGVTAATVAVAAAGQLIMKNVGKVLEEKPAFDTIDAIQRQQWFVNLVNPNEKMGFAGDDMMLPFGNANQNAIWPDGFFL